MGNKGSSVVEMSLIMPIIFGIVVMVIVLFLDTIRDGLVQQEGYSVIYTYQEGAGLHEQLEEMKNAETRDAGQAVISDGNYRYEKEGHVCITEVDVCSNRLRRWQVYGNIVWEQRNLSLYGCEGWNDAGTRRTRKDVSGPDACGK